MFLKIVNQDGIIAHIVNTNHITKIESAGYYTNIYLSDKTIISTRVVSLDDIINCIPSDELCVVNEIWKTTTPETTPPNNN